YQKLLTNHSQLKAMTLASSQRFKAVLLTSLTTIGGLTPLLFETSRQDQVLIPITIVFSLIFPLSGFYLSCQHGILKMRIKQYIQSYIYPQ
ncbi:MAG TPA: hypothetical protein QF353_03170, partial [Gammaproteobacteria bacterium]|nr:hypothetical protein [Gammaproteobacteria bacterium]